MFHFLPGRENGCLRIGTGKGETPPRLIVFTLCVYAFVLAMVEPDGVFGFTARVLWRWACNEKCCLCSRIPKLEIFLDV